MNRLFKGQSTHRKSVISRTAEREVGREKEKIDNLATATKTIQKDTKKGIESQACMTGAELEMSQNLLNKQLCKEDEKIQQTAEKWNKAHLQLDLYSQELNSVSQKAVVDPMKKFTTIFPAVQTSVKKWEQSLEGYSKYHSKVEKGQEKGRTGPNLVKLNENKKILAIAKEDFDKQNSLLMEEMPKLYEGRLNYIQPSFQALMKSQVKYYTDASNVYTNLLKEINDGQPELEEDEYQKKMQQNLNEIKALAITVDD